jgi:NAD(P)H dehydrogenase (quinone)
LDSGFGTENRLKHRLSAAANCRDGIFSGTNDLVEKLTGQKPMPMLDYIVKNKAHFVSQQKNIKPSRT